jgi:hypothetical protein
VLGLLVTPVSMTASWLYVYAEPPSGFWTLHITSPFGARPR